MTCDQIEGGRGKHWVSRLPTDPAGQSPSSYVVNLTWHFTV